MKCKDCKWWSISDEEEDGNLSGHCGRHSPIVIAGMVRDCEEYYDRAIWPRTLEYQSCGEFEKMSMGEQFVEEILTEREKDD